MYKSNGLKAVFFALLLRYKNKKYPPVFHRFIPINSVKEMLGIANNFSKIAKKNCRKRP